MEIAQIVFLALIGFVAGLLGGVLGIGGAIIIIPAMVFFMGYSQHMAQGTTLMMMVLPVGALAAWHYYQKGFVDMKAALILAALFFVGSYFGSRIAMNLMEGLLKKGFAILLILIGIKMLFFSKTGV